MIENAGSMNPRYTSLVVAALWIVPAADASAQTTLRYKFKEGDTLKYTIVQKIKMTMNILGKTIEMSMDQTSEVVWSITSVDDNGNAKIAVKFGRNKMTVENPQGKTQVRREPHSLLPINGSARLWGL